MLHHEQIQPWQEARESIAHRFCAFAGGLSVPCSFVDCDFWVLFSLLCRKALKTLNEDMDPLFEKHLGQVFVLCMSDVCMLAPPRPCKLSRFLSIFDQDAKEFLQQGETHEQ